MKVNRTLMLRNRKNKGNMAHASAHDSVDVSFHASSGATTTYHASYLQTNLAQALWTGSQFMRW